MGRPRARALPDPLQELRAGVTWAQVGGFADLVGEIKPMKGLASPVFTSKFCHFLLPTVFPVVDNEGFGNRWHRAALIAAMTEAVESTKTKLNPEFPMVNKIVELRLIGRQHPLG